MGGKWNGCRSSFAVEKVNFIFKKRRKSSAAERHKVTDILSLYQRLKDGLLCSHRWSLNLKNCLDIENSVTPLAPQYHCVVLPFFLAGSESLFISLIHSLIHSCIPSFFTIAYFCKPHISLFLRSKLSSLGLSRSTL